MKSLMLSISLLALVVAICESSTEHEKAADSAHHLRGLGEDDRYEYELHYFTKMPANTHTTVTDHPNLGNRRDPPPVISKCMATRPIYTIGGESITARLYGNLCDSNDDCMKPDENTEPCCQVDTCRCLKGDFKWAGECMTEVPEAEPELPHPQDKETAAPKHPSTSSYAVAAWNQCTSDIVCEKDGWDDTKDTYSACNSHTDCPPGEKCEVFCYGMDFYCHDPFANGGEGSCTKMACDTENPTINCPGNSVCVDEYSAECGPKVCRDNEKSVSDPYNSCYFDRPCDATNVCGVGESCVGKWLDCFIA